MVICIVPLSEGTNSLDTSKEIKINSNYNGIPEINVASEAIKVKAASKSKVKKKTVKKTVKKVKAVYRYKVKVRYFYKGKWRYKWAYKYYTPTVKAVAAPAPAPVIRDVPYWECYGPTTNCQSNDPAMIAKMHELTTRTVTKPNPNPRPAEPTPVDSPGAEPQQSGFLNEDGSLNTTAYEAAHAAWINNNTAYNDYLAAKNAYDNYNDTITVEETLTDYEKGVNIFEYVQHATSYSFYYNTQRGAVGTLNDRTANCCDHSHLLIALARAAGIPARYIHVECTFSSGLRTGHVWAQLYINNLWYDADAISFSNTLGTIANWNTGTSTLKGVYSSLPF